LRSGISIISPCSKSDPASNGGWRVNVGLLLAEMAILLFFPLPARPQATPPDLTSLSLEDLMNSKVSWVSRTEQKISRTASAIFVITAADIARSGATNIPDLLRMVPGADVAPIDANTWAISVRGFNGRFSNQLLVLVDGRTVYTPTFGGVWWDVLDLPRVGGHRSYPAAREKRLYSLGYFRHDRPRHEGRPRTLFAGRNGWIHYEADTLR